MKKVLILLFAGVLLLMNFASIAQNNNPYNQKGIDFMASVKIIKQDYESGKVTGFTDDAISNYSKTLPLKIEKVEPSLVSDVVNAVKVKNLDVTSFVNNSSMSIFAKQTTNDLLSICKAPNALVNLTNKVTQITTSAASVKDKEFALTLTGVLYNYSSDYIAKAATNGISTNSASSNNCVYNGEPASCTAVGAMIGTLVGTAVGYSCCGPGGALIGALVGAIVGGALGSLC